MRIGWLPHQPRQGAVVHVWVTARRDVSILGGMVRDKSLHFSPSSSVQGRWDALFGIDARQPAGDYEVQIRLARPAGEGQWIEKTLIRVLAEQYPEEHLDLPDTMVHLSDRDLARVKKENARIASLWSRLSPERLWEGSFVLPVAGKPGTPFGVRRWINGEPRNFHTGMDIKAPEGAPVRASNRGRVVLVGDFFFSGRSVFLDHGQGLYTMYFHLSRVRVAEGETVERGEVLGFVGMTGRATGPHLHWGVRLGGARVDPISLIERSEEFPAGLRARTMRRDDSGNGRAGDEP